MFFRYISIFNYIENFLKIRIWIFYWYMEKRQKPYILLTEAKGVSKGCRSMLVKAVPRVPGSRTAYDMQKNVLFTWVFLIKIT